MKLEMFDNQNTEVKETHGVKFYIMSVSSHYIYFIYYLTEIQLNWRNIYIINEE